MTSKGAGDLNIDDLLVRWPAPSREELAWDEAADAITAAAVATGSAAPEGPKDAEALFLPVGLAPEPGEPAATSTEGFAQITKSLGEQKKMADDQNRGGSDPPVSSKRMSLKELAERVSKAPPSRTSQAPASTSTPMPGGPPPLPPGSAPTSTPVPSVRSPLPSSTGSVRATATPLPSSPASSRATSTPLPSRPSEAKSDDSGIVDLHAVREAATAKEKAAAEKAQPATSGLFDEEDPAASQKAPESSAAPVSAAAGAPFSMAGSAKTRTAAGRKSASNTNLFIGVAVGVAGLAAAFAIIVRDKPTPNEPQGVVSETRLEAPADSEPAEEGEAQPEPSRDEGGLALDELPGSEDETTADPAAGKAAGVGGPLAKGDEGTKAEAPAKGEETAKADKPKLPSGGDLASEIEKAAGTDGKSQDVGEPAAGNPKTSQNIPAKPSQGSVQAAVGSVMGGAKACVAAADDVSRATITFSSSGAVQGVAVSGWAAGKGATGCIKSALQGANVGPFSDASYTVGITIRP